MRALNYLGWTLVCLLAIGCSGSRPRPMGGAGGTAGSAPVDPFTLSSRDGTVARDPINGVLAGYALDRWRNPLADVTIEILDLNMPVSGGKRARITTTTDRSGQYKFEGLEPTHQYQVIAVTREGNRVLKGTALGSPPNTRLPIFLSEDFTGADPRSASKDEEKGSETGSQGNRDRTNSVASPAAIIAPPTKAPANDPNYAPTPTQSLPGMGPSPGVGNDPTRTIQDGGFARDPLAGIPGPSALVQPSVPPTPRPAATPSPVPTPAPLPGFQAKLGAPEGPSPDLPEVPVTIPSCLLVGKKLTNFGLYTHEGLPWIYSRDRNRNARIILLDFWSTSCGPCLVSLPTLSAFQKHYGPHGLQVIGIAHEESPWKESVERIRGARGRYNINFTTLVSGDGNGGKCPVETQFDIANRPTVVLLDETGTIIWRKVGSFDEQTRLELENLIRRRLGLRMP